MEHLYEMEYCEIDLRFSKKDLEHLTHLLFKYDLNPEWDYSDRHIKLVVKSPTHEYLLSFRPIGDYYKLNNQHYVIRDVKFAKVLQYFIEQHKGHAIIKSFHNGHVVIQNIQFGMPSRVIEINGYRKKVIYESETGRMVTMEKIIEAFKRNDAERRIPALRNEIDELLILLNLAIEKNNEETVKLCKEKLGSLRHEMLMLEA